jgi:hypothetical protein
MAEWKVLQMAGEWVLRWVSTMVAHWVAQTAGQRGLRRDSQSADQRDTRTSLH